MAPASAWSPTSPTPRAPSRPPHPTGACCSTARTRASPAAAPPSRWPRITRFCTRCRARLLHARGTTGGGREAAADGVDDERAGADQEALLLLGVVDRPALDDALVDVA